MSTGRLAHSYELSAAPHALPSHLQRIQQAKEPIAQHMFDRDEIWSISTELIPRSERKNAESREPLGCTMLVIPMSDREHLNEMAGDAYEAGNIGECNQEGGGTWSKDNFQQKVRNDNARFGSPNKRAEGRYNECVDNDTGGNDWNKVEHYSSKAVHDSKRGWK
ncbi:hypothetical protein ACLMJK_000590 [Lecanora helva]